MMNLLPGPVGHFKTIVAILECPITQEWTRFQASLDISKPNGALGLSGFLRHKKPKCVATSLIL